MRKSRVKYKDRLRKRRGKYKERKSRDIQKREDWHKEERVKKR